MALERVYNLFVINLNIQPKNTECPMMKEKKFCLRVLIRQNGQIKLLRLDIPCSSVGYSKYRKDNQLPKFGKLSANLKPETLVVINKNVLTDGGYTGEKFEKQVKNIIGANVEVVKRNEMHKFVVLPKRWVVERTFAWFEKCRRLWKNCERKISTSLQMVNLAFIALLLRRS